MAEVTITAAAEDLDRLTDQLGGQAHFRLRRLALDRLEAAIDGASYPLVRLRVESAVEQLGLEAELT
jgi:hypothetical protein